MNEFLKVIIINITRKDTALFHITKHFLVYYRHPFRIYCHSVTRSRCLAGEKKVHVLFDYYLQNEKNEELMQKHSDTPLFPSNWLLFNLFEEWSVLLTLH